MIDTIFFFQAEDGIRDIGVTGVQTCALPILFVYGFGWGLAGSAAGTVIAQLGMGAAFAWVVIARSQGLARPSWASIDRKSVVEGKSVDLGGRRIIKIKKFLYHI